MGTKWRRRILLLLPRLRLSQAAEVPVPKVNILTAVWLDVNKGSYLGDNKE